MSSPVDMTHHSFHPAVPRCATHVQDVTLVFTDIEASTAALEQHGDEEWLAILAAHHRIVRCRCTEFGGVESNALGDGFLLAFDALDPALSCAEAIQRDLRTYATAHPGREIHIRIGIHTGTTIVATDGSLVGRDVHLAARVADEAGGDEIVVTAAALDRGAVPPSIHIVGADRVELRGLAGRHELHRAEWS